MRLASTLASVRKDIRQLRPPQPSQRLLPSCGLLNEFHGFPHPDFARHQLWKEEFAKIAECVVLVNIRYKPIKHRLNYGLKRLQKRFRGNRDRKSCYISSSVNSLRVRSTMRPSLRRR